MPRRRIKTTRKFDTGKNILAAVRENPGQIKDLLSDLNALFFGGRTLLTLAIENGENLELIEAIISSGADVNLQNAAGQTALMIASRVDRNDVIELLLSSGAKPDLENYKGRTALYICVAGKNQKGAELLVHTQGIPEIIRMLKSHVKWENIKTMLMALANKSDLNFQDKSGKTLLMYAAELGREDIISFLCQCNADVNIRDLNGRTALMYLFISKTTLTLQALFYLVGSESRVQDSDGKTALMHAFENKFVLPMTIVKILCGEAIIIQDTAIYCRESRIIADHNGVTLAMYALKTGQDLLLDVIRLLLGDSAHCIDKDGSTALIYALNYAPSISVELVQLLGGDIVNKKYQLGRTALMLAIIFRPDIKDEALEYLIGDGINAHDHFGRTPLMYSILNHKSKNRIHLLLKYGADRNIKDFDGKTVFELAFERRHLFSKKELFLMFGDRMSLRDISKDLLKNIIYFKKGQLLGHILIGNADPSDQCSSEIIGNIFGRVCEKFSLFQDCNRNFNILCSNLRTMLIKEYIQNQCTLHSNNETQINQTVFLILIGLDAICCKLETMDYPLFKRCTLLVALTMFSKVDLNKVGRQAVINCLKCHNNLTFNWCCKMNHDLLHWLLRHGIIVKPENVCGSKFKNATPLLVALELGQVSIAKYLISNFCMTTRDLYFISHFYKDILNLQPRFSLFFFENQSLNVSEEIIEFVKQANSQPWPLVKLAMIAVSTAVKLDDTRRERVLKLPIPKIMKNYLLLNSPESNVTFQQLSNTPSFFEHSYSEAPYYVTSSISLLGSLYDVTNTTDFERCLFFWNNYFHLLDYFF